MGMVEAAREKLTQGRPPRIPADVETKLKRGRERLKKLEPSRRECLAFTRNEHYVALSEDGTKLLSQSTTPEALGGKKPDHWIRRSHDLIGPMVQKKISLATQRVPSYEINPAATDHEDYAAAQIAEKIALAGYEQWGLARAFQKLVYNALVTDEGFIMPVWNSSVGPFIDVSQHPDDPEQRDPENPKWVGQGEVEARVWNGLEVMWQPGVDFEKSRWYAVEHARPIEEVEEEAGYQGGKLKADANAEVEGSGRARNTEPQAGLVMVTEYLERPSPQHPEGRHMIFANGNEIFALTPYPLADAKGQVLDEPCMFRLSWAIDGASDRDRGFVRSLIESMREYDYFANKIAQYAQTKLVPQVIAPQNSLLTPITDQPGAVIYYDAAITNAAGRIPEFRPDGEMPSSLLTLQDRARNELGYIGFDNEIPSQVESAKGAEFYSAKDNLAWQNCVANLATVHAGFMRSALTLVQRFYTEERILSFRGATGWESIKDFMGADLRGQTDVRVQPGSLQLRTRAESEERIFKITQMFPGVFSPEEVISALNSHTPEKLIERYEGDVAHAHNIIQTVKDGTFEQIPDRKVIAGEEVPNLDPDTGEPVWLVEPERDEAGKPVPGTGEMELATEVPGWMPWPFANAPVQRAQWEAFMKTDAFTSMDADRQGAAMTVYNYLRDLEAKEAQRSMELKTRVAEDRGLEGATKPPEPKEPPSMPGPAEETPPA